MHSSLCIFFCCYLRHIRRQPICTMKYSPVRYLVLLFLLFVQQANSQYVFEFNENCQNAYREIFSLRIGHGQQLLKAEKAHNPNNLIPDFLENYIDFLVLFFNEDPLEFDKRKGNLAKRLERIDKGPQDSPFFLLSKSVINLQWAAVHVKLGSRWDAGWMLRRAYIQSRDNVRRFPHFSPSYLYNGLLQVSAGTVPDGYRWLSSLMGVKGTVDGGMKQVREFLNNNEEYAKMFRDEAIFYYLYLMFYVQNERQAVFDFIRDQKLDVVNNHMFAYLATNLHINAQRSAEAEKFIVGRNPHPSYFQTPVWNLEMGYVCVNRGSPDAADYLQKFVRDFKGRFYVKDALQKISWHYYLNGDSIRARDARQSLLDRAGSETEADKLAQKEAASGKWPNKLLLRARLLNDGGYLREALALFHGKSIEDFNLTEEKLEFCYRVGRLYDDLGNTRGAIDFYRQAVRLGEKRTEHYAARAALQIGFLYEKQHQKQAALEWFRRCLSMKNHDFKDSLDQRAKAGIKRCEERA